MKKLFLRIKMFIARRKANKELTEAIIQADQMYSIHKKRFYVIPDTKHRLRVLSWTELKQMKKQGLFSNKVKEPDFIRESFYYTPSRFGEFMRPETKDSKRKMWLEYYKAYRL